jgi:hypothetical protein
VGFVAAAPPRLAQCCTGKIPGCTLNIEVAMRRMRAAFGTALVVLLTAIGPAKCQTDPGTILMV